MRELLLNFHLSHTPSSLVKVPQPVYQVAQSGISEDGILMFTNIRTQCLYFELENWNAHVQYPLLKLMLYKAEIRPVHFLV